jgi:hypothetical protein
MSAKGSEFLQENITIDELTTRLEELSMDGWQVVSIISGHANPHEIGDRAHFIVILKRPKK